MCLRLMCGPKSSLVYVHQPELIELIYILVTAGVYAGTYYCYSSW